MISEEQANEDVCYVTTTGRRTGQAHTIEIWFAVEPQGRDTLYVLSGGGDSADWVRNVRKHDGVTVRVGAAMWEGTAHVMTDSDDGDPTTAAALVFAKYEPTYGRTHSLGGWRDRSLPVAIQLARAIVS